jgi:hypothetical protein
MDLDPRIKTRRAEAGSRARHFFLLEDLGSDPQKSYAASPDDFVFRDTYTGSALKKCLADLLEAVV